MAFREELQKRIEKKHAEIATLSAKLKEAEIYTQALEDMLKLLPKEDGAVGSEVVVDASLREGSIVARAKEALQKAGRPMHVTELLSEMGRPADKENRAAIAGSIGAYVRRNEIFTRPGPNIFGLIGMKPLHPQGEVAPPPNFGVDEPTDQETTEPEPDPEFTF
jgi:hypothetical protein